MQNVKSKFTGLWHHPDFMKLWTGESISLFGSQITAFSIPIIAVLVLHASPAQMGLLGALAFAPFIIFSLFAGVWVDRLRRRPIMIISNIGRALIVGSVPVAYALNFLTIEYLYIVEFVVGTLTVFFEVSYQAYLPSLVGREQLVEGNSKLEVSRSLSQLLGPGLAGALVNIISAPLTIILDALSFVVSALFLGAIRQAETINIQQQKQQGMWKSIGEGLRRVLGNPILRSMAACTAMINLFSSVISAVYSLYILDELLIDPATFGIMMSVASGGALLGALFASRIAQRFGLGRTIVASAVLFGLGFVLVPLAGGPQWAVITLITLGQFVTYGVNPIYNVNAISLRQRITPFALQGRVNASIRFMVWGTLPLGSLLGGFLGEVIGLRMTLLVGGIGASLAFLWILFSPVVALREQPEEMSDESKPVSEVIETVAVAE